MKVWSQRDIVPHDTKRGKVEKEVDATKVDTMDCNISDKERLTRWYDLGAMCAATLTFGRKMPFGKYKGMYMYCLIIKHPMYLNWILDNTHFQLTETEEWWKRQIDAAIEKYRSNRLIFGLVPLMKLGGVDNMENPHWIVE